MCLVGLALLRKILKFDYRDSWGYVKFSKDSESGFGIVLAQKTKKLGGLQSFGLHTIEVEKLMASKNFEMKILLYILWVLNPNLKEFF